MVIFNYTKIKGEINMNSDKLFIEVMQNMEDLIRLFEKAIVLESHLYTHYRELIRQGLPTELQLVLEIQIAQLHDAFERLEDAMHE